MPIATVGSVLSHRTSGLGDEVALLGLRFELFVEDVEASVSFYGATLGLVPPENWSPDGYVPLRAGAVTVGVQNHTKVPVDHHFSASPLARPAGRRAGDRYRG